MSQAEVQEQDPQNTRNHWEFRDFLEVTSAKSAQPWTLFGWSGLRNIRRHDV